MRYGLYNEDQHIGDFDTEEQVIEAALDYYMYEAMPDDVAGLYISDHTAVVLGEFVLITHPKHGTCLRLNCRDYGEAWKQIDDDVLEAMKRLPPKPFDDDPAEKFETKKRGEDESST